MSTAVQHERGPRNSTLRRQMALYFKDAETPNMPPLDLALPKVTSSTSSPPRTMPPPHPMHHHPSPPPPPPQHHPLFFASTVPKVSRTLFIMTVIVTALVARRWSIITSSMYSGSLYHVSWRRESCLDLSLFIRQAYNITGQRDLV